MVALKLHEIITTHYPSSKTIECWRLAMAGNLPKFSNPGNLYLQNGRLSSQLCEFTWNVICFFSLFLKGKVLPIFSLDQLINLWKPCKSAEPACASQCPPGSSDRSRQKNGWRHRLDKKLTLNPAPYWIRRCRNEVFNMYRFIYESCFPPCVSMCSYHQSLFVWRFANR